tara:strand:+ start:785 stop:1018 length:234 start_codon:yes stop_codon:yes gene_type:complete
MSDFYYLLGEDADNEVTVIAGGNKGQGWDMRSIEEELCKEVEKGDFKNLRTFHLTNEGGHDDRGYLTRSEWVAINEF